MGNLGWQIKQSSQNEATAHNTNNTVYDPPIVDNTRTSSQFQLKYGFLDSKVFNLLGIFLISILATLSFSLFNSLFTSANILKCGSGLDSLGCAVVSVFLTLALEILLTTVITAGILYVIRVPAAIFVSFVGGILFFFSLSLIRTINTYLGILPIVTIFCFFFAAYLLAYFCFSAIKSSIIVKIILAIVFLTGFYFLVSFITNKVDYQLYNQKEQTLLNQIVQKGQEKSSESFEIFVPSYIVPGYKFGGGHLQHFFKPDFYEISYSSLRSDVQMPSPYSMYIFAKPDYYNPPTNCGWETPSIDVSQPCQVTEKLDNGNDLYFAELTHAHSRIYYELIDNTVITTNITGLGQISTAEVVNIYNSLEKKSPEDLQKLNESLNK